MENEKKTQIVKSKTRILAECAVMVGLATVLSMVKMWEMPLGGSITLLSMLPIMLIALRHGTVIGLGTAFVYACGQLFLGLSSLMSWGMTPVMWVGSVVFDYLLAFTLLGFAGIFKKYGFAGAVGGIVSACALRFISHFISGAIFFAVWCPEGWNVVLYSICYNGAYMGVELILTVAGASLLLASKPIRRLVGI